MPKINTGREYLLVDGYNILFAWKDLNADTDLEGAKERLITMLCNYKGVNKVTVILVFDAYKVSGGTGSVEQRGGIYVVYTKEAETADSYIERTTHELSKNETVRVATSDGLEQVIIMGGGALRMSARELRIELGIAKKEINSYIELSKPAKNNMLVDNLDRNAADFLENLRRKK